MDQQHNGSEESPLGSSPTGGSPLGSPNSVRKSKSILSTAMRAKSLKFRLGRSESKSQHDAPSSPNSGSEEEQLHSPTSPTRSRHSGGWGSWKGKPPALDDVFTKDEEGPESTDGVTPPDSPTSPASPLGRESSIMSRSKSLSRSWAKFRENLRERYNSGSDRESSGGEIALDDGGAQSSGQNSPGGSPINIISSHSFRRAKKPASLPGSPVGARRLSPSRASQSGAQLVGQPIRLQVILNGNHIVLTCMDIDTIERLMRKTEEQLGSMGVQDVPKIQVATKVSGQRLEHSALLGHVLDKDDMVIMETVDWAEVTAGYWKEILQAAA